MLRRGLHCAVGLICLALGVRTFLAAGLIGPMVVEGSSMSPWAHGERLRVDCQPCGGSLDIGMDQLPVGESAPCVFCDEGELDLTHGERVPADAIWIDRTAPIERWAPVVLRSPTDASSLVVKRVLGLPGETIEFHDGDLWVDGQRVVKSLEEQLAVRRLAHRESEADPRWELMSGNRTFNQHALTIVPSPNSFSRFKFSDSVSDECLENLSASRRPKSQSDLMLEIRTAMPADSALRIHLGPARAMIDTRSWTVDLATKKPTDHALKSIAHAPRLIQLSLFDGRTTLALDGKVVAELAVSSAVLTYYQSVTFYDRPFRITEFSLWQDLYYEPRPDAQNLPGDQPWRLGPDEYFVVGDNQAVSLDSRNWSAPAGVPARLILGRAVKAGGR